MWTFENILENKKTTLVFQKTMWTFLKCIDISELKYILCVHQEDLEVAKMYPDVTGMKEVSMYVYRPDEDSEED